MDALCELSEDEQEAVVARALEVARSEREGGAGGARSLASTSSPCSGRRTGGREGHRIGLVKAAGAAHGEPIEETPDDDAAPAAETPAQAPTTTNGHAANVKPDDDRPLAEKLHYALNDVWSLCQDQNNWPHLSADQKVELRGAMTKLGYLRDLLPRLATLKPVVH